MKIKFQSSSLKTKILMALVITAAVSYGGFLMFFLTLLAFMVLQDLPDIPISPSEKEGVPA